MLIRAEIFFAQSKEISSLQDKYSLSQQILFYRVCEKCICFLYALLYLKEGELQNSQRPGELKINFPCIILNMMVRVMTRLTCALKS